MLYVLCKERNDKLSFLIESSKDTKKRRLTATMEILAEIKNRILKGKLKPGDKLPTEQELVDEFVVSRTVIREAIKMLEAVGLVKIIRGSGTYITLNPTSSFIQTLTLAILYKHSNKEQIYELRKFIEIGALESVIEKYEKKDIYEMEKSIENMKSLVGIDDSDFVNHVDAARFDLMFHRAYIEATHNPLLISLVDGMWETLFFSIESSITKKKDLERTIKNHLAILKSIEKRDIGKSRQAIIKALEDWKKFSLL